MQFVVMRTFVYLLVFFHSVSSGDAFLVSDGLQRVHTQHGEIIGHIANVQLDEKASQVVKFLGIPYAEPPIGDLRFKKPVPVKSIKTPYAAHKFGFSCVQQQYLPTSGMSEDCLYLNVYVPYNAGDLGIVSKSVLIFIHGGGFVGGSGDVDLGVFSSYTDTIGVTINYRLDALGFFSTHDKYAPGNYGLWDQHVAIQWVKDNIASFGGDPSNITIFGESAGSSAVVYQTLYPGSKGVFSRAIAESGTLSAWGVTPKQANYNGSLTLAGMLNCTSSSHEQIMTCLRAVSSKDMEKAIVAYDTTKNYFFTNIIPTWVPVYDGEFVIADPTEILSELNNPATASKFASYYDIDLIIGMNNYDGAVYSYFLEAVTNANLTANPSALTDKILKDRIIPAFLELAGLPQTPLFRDAVFNEYIKWQNIHDGLGRVNKTLQMLTDSGLRAPTIATAAPHGARNPNTYIYQFSALPPLPYTTLPAGLQGANHADELPYVFGFDKRIINFIYIGKDVVISEEHVKLSKAMMTMWSNFAKSGNPNFPVSLGPDVHLQWLAYEPKQQQYLEITWPVSQMSVKSRLAARGVAFWNDLLPAWKSLITP